MLRGEVRLACGCHDLVRSYSIPVRHGVPIRLRACLVRLKQLLEVLVSCFDSQSRLVLVLGLLCSVNYQGYDAQVDCDEVD